MYYDNKSIPVDQYLRKLSGQDKDTTESTYDHNYIKHWSTHAGSDRTKPARMLFMNICQRSEPRYACSDEEIDVVDFENPIAPSPFDNQRTKILANELEQNLKSNLTSLAERSELDDFPIENCSPQRRKIYREVMEIINEDLLAKIVYSGQTNEFIQKKTVTERCAKQLRIVLANTFYDFDIILWIHELILSKGSLSIVTSYLSILQVIRTKIPSIVEKMIKSYSGQLGYGYLNQILKKSWDPSVPVLNQYRPKKLPRNPLLIMNCAGFNLNKTMNESSRFHFWSSHLNALCKTIQIPMKYVEDGNTTFGDVIDDTMLALKNKITEFRNHYPNRPVILAGWTIGAVIACLVALETEVDAVICFGFSLTGVNGSRGGLDDPLLDSKVPILFIVGQNSNMCSIDDIEDFRSRMKGVSGLVVIGGADDFLNIPPQKMMTESITQEIVDRCILDEISNFIESCIMKPPATSSASPVVVSNTSLKSCPPIREESPDIINPNEIGKRKRRRPKEYSPELISSRKKPYQRNIPEVSNVSVKTHIPSRPGRKGRHHLSKPGRPCSDRKSADKQLSASSRKRIMETKLIPETPKEKSPVNSAVKEIKTGFSSFFSIAPPEEPEPAKPVIPFALNILPKKNVPVDVEKAFGSDSSFLPRPLTPPEPEDNTVSAEETESAIGELEADFASSVTNSKSATTSFASVTTAVAATTAVATTATTATVAAAAVATTFAAVTATSTTLASTTVASIIGTVATTEASTAVNQTPVLVPSEPSTSNLQDLKSFSSSFIKHVITGTSDATKLVSTASPTIKTVFLKEKIMTSSPGSQIKNVVDISGRTAAHVKGPSTTKTMITVPLNAGPLLVSGQTLKTPSGKIFQFLSKSRAQSKEPLVPKLIVAPHETVPQQVYNISTLSEGTKKIATTSSATLVKLAVPDKSTQSIKHIQVIKPQRLEVAKETPAEMIEKQLAIQALNESVSLESCVDDPKPTASIISRVVPRPSHHIPYIRQSIIAHPSVRGRMRPLLPNKFQIYPK